MMRSNKYSSGFAMPVVLIVSAALIVLSVALLQSVTSLRTFALNQYYAKLAEEAAEAGAGYADSCLENNSRNQTWGSNAIGGSAKPNLTQQTDCFGNNSFPGNTVVASDSRIQTGFEVGNLDFAVPNSVQLSVRGYTQIRNSTGTAVLKTYEQIIKRSITWDPNLIPQKSSSGTLRTCGILSNNVYCWGQNDSGQLGNNTTTDSRTPVQVYRDPSVLGNKKIVDLVAGGAFTCAATDSNEVFCWGKNNNGQLGQGSTFAYSSVPLKVTGLSGKNIVKLGVSASTACGITDTRDLYCWGSNTAGQIGNGIKNSTPVTTPVLVGGPSASSGGLAGKAVSDVVYSGAYNTHMCAIDSNGLLYCWGSNVDGELGLGTNTQTYYSPTAVTGGALSGKKVLKVASDGNAVNDETGDAHTCALYYTTTVSDAKVACWGSNANGQLGIGNGGTWSGTGSWTAGNNPAAWIYKSPTTVDLTGVLNGKTFTDFSVSDGSNCIVASSRAYCVGTAGQRGDGGTGRTKTYVAVDDGNGIFLNNNVDSIVGGAQRVCATVKAKIYCWGANTVGQVGDGTTDSPKRRPSEAIFLRPKNTQYTY